MQTCESSALSATSTAAGEAGVELLWIVYKAVWKDGIAPMESVHNNTY